jgi:putative ABC transport system permease protein
MNTYITIPLRYLRGRMTRTILTTLAIVFGVAVIFGVNILLPSLLSVVNAGVVGATGQAQVTVNSAGGATFDDSVLAAVRQTGGVAAASPVFRREIVLPGATATQLTVVGADPATAQQVRSYQVVSGRFLTDADTRVVVLTNDLAQKLNMQPGGTLHLPTPTGLVDLPVVGVVVLPGESDVVMPLATAQNLFNAAGRINAIDVAVAAGSDRDSLQQALQAKLGPAFKVGSATLASDTFASLQLALVMFNFFGVLTLFMAGFLIFNTFRAVVVERRHDIGMLRAVGATRGTIIRLILAESVLQGVAGTAIGLVLGYLLGAAGNAALENVLQQFMAVRTGTEVVITPSNLALSIGLGILVTALAGLWPAISASRVPVLVALRAETTEATARRSLRGPIAGGVLLLLGLAGLVSGNSSLGALGALLFLAGLVVLLPSALHPIARVIEPAMRWMFAREGQIAEGNMQRNPGRAAVTVSALMIGLAIIIGIASVLSSVIGVINTYGNRSLSSDVLLLPQNLALWGSDVGVGPDFEEKLAQVPGVGTWTGVRYAGAQVNSTSVQVLGLDPVSYPKVTALTFDQGDQSTYAKLGQGRYAIIDKLYASGARLNVGDTLNIDTPAGPQTYQIVGIGTDLLNYKINTIYISQANLSADFHVNEDFMVMANLAPGADAAQVRSAINGLLAGYPQLTLYWGADYRATTLATLNAVFGALYILLLVLMIPSALGLINTLTINVLERTREIGVLRAIGATRAQIRKLVVAESLLLAAAGTTLGILGGIALGWVFTTFLAASFSSGVTFSIPFAWILLAIVVALVIALLASAIPARQAARLQIVRALQFE